MRFVFNFVLNTIRNIGYLGNRILLVLKSARLFLCEDDTGISVLLVNVAPFQTDNIAPS